MWCLKMNKVTQTHLISPPKQIIIANKQSEVKTMDKTERNYKCGWCGYTFTQKVATFNHVSDQVKCNMCHNFLKTWERGQDK